MVSEKSLTQSREYDENIINTVREPLVVLDQDLRVVSVNRSFYNVFKVKPEETVGQLIYNLGNKQWDIPKLRELLETILPEKISFDNYEVEHDFAGIGRRVMLLNARQIVRRMGKERIILLAIEDVTERMQWETLLKDSEERYRRLFETANDGILLLEKREFKIRHANPAITAMSGYSNEECIGKEMKDIGFPDAVDTVQEILQTLDKDGIIYYEDIPLQKKTGQVVDTDIYLVDKASLVQCNIRDITERKQTKEALLESELRYHLLFEEAQDGIALADAETGEMVDCNRALCRMTEQNKTDLLGQPQSILHQQQQLIKGHSPSFLSHKTGNPGQTIEDGLLSKSGKIIPVEIKSSRFLMNGRNYFLGIFRDITDRKRSEKEKDKLEARLIQAQKMEAIGTLAGGIAHDFNNILSAVIGYTELAQMNLESDSAIKNDLKEVLTAAGRAKDLVKQILAFSRQTKEEQMPVQVGLIAKEALKLIRSSLPTTIDIRQNILSKSIVLSDPTQLHQIVMNLCTNAAHAMQAKGGILEITLTDVALDSDFCLSHPEIQPGAFLKLSVSDTGHGMTPEVMSRIFDPFFTTKPKDKGTGLGLSVVHGIVKDCGGTISVYSEPDKGTAFNLYFPIIAGRAEERPEEHTILPTGTERILVVDDEKAIIDITQKILTSMGYVVEARTSSLEALALFKAMPAKFDLVITDMTMPQMTGDALARELMKVRPDLPVILCTGFSEKITMEKAETMGIKAFLLKPLLKEEMAHTIRRVLDE